ncbi:MAG: helix-turn-helix domain-containing protein [Ancalomicrobiaceae bacterium]|nr:helix-turn-helix domain-containing protein [Ancalomicrobiaceae bacterium]
MTGYPYQECGLDNVIIEGVNFLVDDKGEETIAIPNINGLHRAIATGIVAKKSSLTGRELRFLRTEMGLTQAELAHTVHREPLSISRWERGEVAEIDPNAEALIRLLAKEALDLEVEATVREITGWSVPSALTPPLVIDGSDTDNYRLKPAA